MDFRERLLRNDLRCLSDNVTTISDELILIRNFVLYKFGSEFKQFSASNSSSKSTYSKSSVTLDNSSRIRRTGGKGIQSKSINSNTQSESDSEELTKSNRRNRRKRKIKASKSDDESESEKCDSGNGLPLPTDMFEIPEEINPNVITEDWEDNLGEDVPIESVGRSKKSSHSIDFGNNDDDDKDLNYTENDSDPDFDLSQIGLKRSKSRKPRSPIKKKIKNEKLTSYCPVCEANVSTSNRKKGLIIHIKSHTEKESESKQVCHICCNKFENVDVFMKHKGKCDSNLHCSFCGMNCGDKSNRIVHERIHTGELPFACTLCRKKFNTRYNLERHLASNVHS